MGQSLPDPGTPLAVGDIHWRCTLAGGGLLQTLGPIRFDSLPHLAGFEVLKRKTDRLWGRFRSKDGDFFVKARKLERFRRRVRTLFRPSAMREEWSKAWWLIAKRISTPEPVAVGEVRRHGMVQECLYVSRWIEGARPLRAFLADSEASLPTTAFEKLRHRVTEELGALLGSLHEAGSYHWEFHDMNVLVTTPREGLPTLLPIDLDHLIVPDFFTEEDRAWNLHQLAWYLRKPIARWMLGRRDLIRFFKGYHRAAPKCAAGWKEIFRRMSVNFPMDPPTERPHRRQFKAVQKEPS